MKTLIISCGLGHFALCIASTFIPRLLHWKRHLAVLPPLFRQMFWTYAGYILMTNLVFGTISVLAAEELLNGSVLAGILTLFIGLYWLGRIAIQFLYFDKSAAPTGLVYTIGEIALVGLFVLFALVYLTAFLINTGCL